MFKNLIKAMAFVSVTLGAITNSQACLQPNGTVSKPFKLPNGQTGYLSNTVDADYQTGRSSGKIEVELPETARSLILNLAHEGRPLRIYSFVFTKLASIPDRFLAPGDELTIQVDQMDVATFRVPITRDYNCGEPGLVDHEPAKTPPAVSENNSFTREYCGGSNGIEYCLGKVNSKDYLRISHGEPDALLVPVTPMRPVTIPGQNTIVWKVTKIPKDKMPNVRTAELWITAEYGEEPRGSWVVNKESLHTFRMFRVFGKEIN